MHKRFLIFLGVLAWCGLVLGCAPRPEDALRQAEQAIQEAEQAGAREKAPEPYRQALDHLEQGKSQEGSMRYNLAASEYECARENAELALELVEAREAEDAKDCCPDLDDCRSGLSECRRDLTDREADLQDCRARKVTTIRPECPACPECPEKQCPETACAFMGAIMVQGPPAIEPGKTDYTVSVSFIASRLDGDGGPADDYRILIDITERSPQGVEVFSPTANFESLKKRQWDLNVNVPEDFHETVELTIEVTLWNSKTDKQQKLPAYKVVIPAAGAPECPECPPPAEKGANWLLAVILLAVGLAVGAGIGALVKGRAA